MILQSRFDLYDRYVSDSFLMCLAVRYNYRLGFNCKTYQEKKMSEQNETTIVVLNNGPYRILGENIVIKDLAGNTFGLAGRTVVSLCRCGHSENKPFCDGTHARIGFQSEVEARELPPPAPKL
jgi:CDGSH-type Zn-finger protein